MEIFQMSSSTASGVAPTPGLAAECHAPFSEGVGGLGAAPRVRMPYARAVLRSEYRKGTLTALGRLKSVAGSDPSLPANQLPGLPPLV